MIAITFDTEWSPPEVLAYTFDMMNQHEISSTWFCTDDGNAKRVITSSGHELAIHPNFKSVETERATLARLLSIYPRAKGVRSHSAYFHTRLTDIYKRLGIEYDCNYVIPARVKPWWLLNGILEIPINYADNYMFIQENWLPLHELERWRNPTVCIFSFHPVHVYLNTRCQKDYENVKRYYHDPEKLSICRNQRAPGTRDYLVKLLEHIRKRDVETCTMRQINEQERRRT